MLASNGPLARTYLRFGLTLLGVYVILYGLPEWMEVALHLSPGQSGLLLIPMGAIATVISRPIASRNLVRGPLIISAACLFLGGLATLFLTGSSPLVAVLGVTALFGITTGTTSVSTQTALYVQTPAETVGTASGLLRTSGYLGSVASATITGAAFRSRVSDTGLHTLATVLLGIGIVVLLLTVFDRTVTTRNTISPPMRAPVRTIRRPARGLRPARTRSIRLIRWALWRTGIQASRGLAVARRDSLIRFSGRALPCSSARPASRSSSGRRYPRPIP